MTGPVRLSRDRLTPALAGLVAYSGPTLEKLRVELGLDCLVNLGANECPEGPFPEVREAIAQALGQANRYPNLAADALRAQLASTLPIAPEKLMFGNGSCELLQLLAEAFVAPGEHLVFAEPSFVMYETIARARQARYVAVPLVDQRHDLAAMARVISARTKLVVICNPNNPTGTYVGPAELRVFLQEVPAQTVVVLDEAYIQYVTFPEHEDTLQWLDAFPNLVILRTFSKIYSLAGLRVGWGAADEVVVEAVDKLRQPYNVNAVAQAAATEALRHPERVEERRQHVARERERLRSTLTAWGVETVPSEANFLLVSVRGLTVEPEEAPGALLARGVLVRSGAGVGCPGWIRLTVGNNDENSIFLEALRDLLASEGS